MNAEHLLAHYEQIADAPDAIARLRRFILDLAVRGRLVPQDSKDEPAGELLKRIEKEKARLLKEGKAKRQDPLPEPDLNQAPFELPLGWTWARFPEVGTFGRGKSKHRPRNDPALFDGGEHLMIQTGDVARSRGIIETYTNKYNDFGLAQSFKWPKGTLCITIAANIADSGILNFDACFPDSVVGFIPAPMFENARYFDYFVRTAKANLLEFAPATAQKNINLEILTQVLIPLPPLAEQHRIVAKIDELMGLCDRLEAARGTREAARDRLAAASLARLNAPDPETFQADARFALDALAAFTMRPDQIKQLRQTILNLAIRGMLVPQDPNDEPIPLLAATRPTPAILPSGANRRTEGKQASLPSGWIVAKGELSADFIDPQPSHRTPPRYDGGIPYIGYGDITSCGKIDFDGARKVSPDVLVEHRQRYTLQKGDFVIGKIGTIGDPVFLEAPFNYALSANLMLVQPKSSIVAPAYLFVFFESPTAIATLQLQSTDSTHAVFGIKKARELLIPLPPLAEQYRIIAKVDELMALCDRLEANLTATAATRRCLLDALLAEALAPAEERELEAAE